MRGTFKIWYKAQLWLEDSDETDTIIRDGDWILIINKYPRVKFNLFDCRITDPAIDSSFETKVLDV